MIYGYARVSTTDQDPALQTAALDAQGCTSVVTDHASDLYGVNRAGPMSVTLVAVPNADARSVASMMSAAMR
jgi:hypothetical protein